MGGVKDVLLWLLVLRWCVCVCVLYLCRCVCMPNPYSDGWCITLINVTMKLQVPQTLVVSIYRCSDK